MCHLPLASFLLSQLTRAGTRFPLRPHRLVDFSERILYDTAAALLAPLVKEHGRLVVTDARVYFQPLNNVTGTISDDDVTV